MKEPLSRCFGESSNAYCYEETANEVVCLDEVNSKDDEVKLTVLLDNEEEDDNEVIVLVDDEEEDDNEVSGKEEDNGVNGEAKTE